MYTSFASRNPRNSRCLRQAQPPRVPELVEGARGTGGRLQSRLDLASVVAVGRGRANLPLTVEVVADSQPYHQALAVQ